LGFPPVEHPAAPDPAEAAALAAAFAADCLSWDEDNPGRRVEVLRGYLPGDADHDDPVWSGHGRQRADLALPGAVRPGGAGGVVVDVRVRITPYRAVGEHSTADPLQDDGLLGVPAAAPAPTSPGWRGLPTRWVRLAVPVRRHEDRLVVDAPDVHIEGHVDTGADGAPT